MVISELVDPPLDLFFGMAGLLLQASKQFIFFPFFIEEVVVGQFDLVPVAFYFQAGAAVGCGLHNSGFIAWRAKAGPGVVRAVRWRRVSGGNRSNS
jgi:hypothetical protein